MALSMWKPQGDILVLDATNYLKKEFGVSLKALQDDNTMEAIADPSEFIVKRTNKVNDLMAETGAVGKAFKERYEHLTTKLFFPEEMARQMAKQSAQRVYEEELSLLELEAPDGYKRAFQISELEHNKTIQASQISGGINEHDVISKYKSYKRAKKASKKSQK